MASRSVLRKAAGLPENLAEPEMARDSSAGRASSSSRSAALSSSPMRRVTLVTAALLGSSAGQMLSRKPLLSSTRSSTCWAAAKAA